VARKTNLARFFTLIAAIKAISIKEFTCASAQQLSDQHALGGGSKQKARFQAFFRREAFLFETGRGACNKQRVIKFVFRWAFRLLVLAIVLAVAALLLKDTVARNIAEQRIRRDTGFDAKIGRLEISLFSPTVRIENLVLYNPVDYGGSTALEVPDLHFEYARDALAFGRLHFKLLRLNLRELHVVENHAGRTNIIDLLHQLAPEALGKDKNSTDREPYTFTGIDLLNLSIGKVRYTNLRLPGRNQEVNLGLENEIVRDVRSEQDLAAILFKALLRAGITIYLDRPGQPARRAI
jgi:hypothetical protein